MDRFMMADVPIHRWTGGASWPWFILRVGARWPLAVLELSGTTLTLSDRLGGIVSFFTLSHVVLAPADVRVVFPCRWFGNRRTIAIVANDGKIFEFFRFGPRSEILDTLVQAGFPVDRKERRGFRRRNY